MRNVLVTQKWDFFEVGLIRKPWFYLCQLMWCMYSFCLLEIDLTFEKKPLLPKKEKILCCDAVLCNSYLIHVPRLIANPTLYEGLKFSPLQQGCKH